MTRNGCPWYGASATRSGRIRAGADNRVHGTACRLQAAASPRSCRFWTTGNSRRAGQRTATGGACRSGSLPGRGSPASTSTTSVPSGGRPEGCGPPWPPPAPDRRLLSPALHFQPRSPECGGGAGALQCRSRRRRTVTLSAGLSFLAAENREAVIREIIRFLARAAGGS
jgi:hypothetical protein